MTLAAAHPFFHVLWKVLRSFGAFAFFPLGLLDMSVVPTPGSFDALLIVMAAAHRELWWYYALMATAGSVFGAWPSFQLARKRGEEVLIKRLGESRARKVFKAFERRGFWAMFVGAVAPPPVPATAFVFAAGALNYAPHKFLLSWSTGRLVRFGVVAWVAARYGRRIFNWLRGYYLPALWALIALAVVGAAVALWFLLRSRRRKAAQAGAPVPPEQRAA